ncbi:hypothetical protein HK102_002747, partial [Quaeritorhiza haematococci]
MSAVIVEVPVVANSKLSSVPPTVANKQSTTRGRSVDLKAHKSNKKARTRSEVGKSAVANEAFLVRNHSDLSLPLARDGYDSDDGLINADRYTRRMAKGVNAYLAGLGFPVDLDLVDHDEPMVEGSPSSSPSPTSPTKMTNFDSAIDVTGAEGDGHVPMRLRADPSLVGEEKNEEPEARTTDDNVEPEELEPLMASKESQEEDHSDPTSKPSAQAKPFEVLIDIPDEDEISFHTACDSPTSIVVPPPSAPSSTCSWSSRRVPEQGASKPSSPLALASGSRGTDADEDASDEQTTQEELPKSPPQNIVSNEDSSASPAKKSKKKKNKKKKAAGGGGALVAPSAEDEGQKASVDEGGTGDENPEVVEFELATFSTISAPDVAADSPAVVPEGAKDESKADDTTAPTPTTASTSSKKKKKRKSKDATASSSSAAAKSGPTTDAATQTPSTTKSKSTTTSSSSTSAPSTQNKGTFT